MGRYLTRWCTIFGNNSDLKRIKGGKIIKRTKADVRTLLRLPTGIFYAQGVKANVLFFDRKPADEKPWTEKLWIYDLRTNKHFTLKENPLKRSDLDDFVTCYNPKNRHERKESDRFKSFTYEELTKRDKLNLDIFWLKDESLEDSANLPDPDVIAAQLIQKLPFAHPSRLPVHVVRSRDLHCRRLPCARSAGVTDAFSHERTTHAARS